MLLEGSCHCGAVAFTLESKQPCPYNRCYCSICRKTAGGGGYAINLGGDADSLRILRGEDRIRVYQVVDRDADGAERKSSLERRFCGDCGSALWCWDARWPDLIHPFASAIDTDLPTPPETVHLMLDFKAGWVEPSVGPKDKTFARYPEESLADWHERVNMVR